MLRAARALAERVPGLKLGRFRLIKALPVAAGLGGGSSDAAAALRALAALNGLALDDERMFEAARATGADVPVCLDPRARVMTGVGHRVGPALGLAAAAGVACQSRRRRAYAPRLRRPGPCARRALGFGPTPAPEPGGDPLAALRTGRNDLQAPAQSIAPEIAEVLASLSASGASLARMSGSGATCFALYPDRHAAARAARALQAARPRWWVRATYLR